MKVSVIIPAYNAHKTITRCLASIMIQSIIDDVEVIVVDDYSEHGYENEIKIFRPFMNIREVTLETNGGPGVARQAGIDDCKTPLFTCIDADDTFSGAYALECLRSYMESDNTINMVSSVFIEVHDEDELKGTPKAFVPHQNDLVWMFGKMYRKPFIDANKIRFNETRANEDNGFNCKVNLCSQPGQIKYITDITYYWHDNPNSITRKDNCQYSYDQSFVGYVDNMIDAIKHCKKVNPFNAQITQHAYEVMFNLYTYYLETKKRDDRFLEQALVCCKKYYDEIYSKLDEIAPEIMSSLYAKSVMGKYQLPVPQWHDIVPDLLFKDFIYLLKECKNTVVK